MVHEHKTLLPVLTILDGAIESVTETVNWYKSSISLSSGDAVVLMRPDSPSILNLPLAPTASLYGF